MSASRSVLRWSRRGDEGVRIAPEFGHETRLIEDRHAICAGLYGRGLGASMRPASRYGRPFDGLHAQALKPVRKTVPGRGPADLVCIARMRATPQNASRPSSLARRLVPLVVVLLPAAGAYLSVGQEAISLEALVRHPWRSMPW